VISTGRSSLRIAGAIAKAVSTRASKERRSMARKVWAKQTSNGGGLGKRAAPSKGGELMENSMSLIKFAR